MTQESYQKKILFKDIPGLYLFTDFFDSTLSQKILRESLDIHEHLLNELVFSTHQESVTIPQPDITKIQPHNSLSEEKFFRLNIKDVNDKELNSEYFPRYGEEGHALLYFRGTENIPLFAKNILPRIKHLIHENNIVIKNMTNSWRLTMNFYASISGIVSGFPFHVDIPANGVVTMILNIHREAIFQITNGSEIFDIKLPVDALLLLSGESRYKWKHRILPSKSESPSQNSIERVSLVLGVK